jgi:predicted RNA-binding protein with PIN domain
MPLIIDGYNLLHVTGITGRHGDLHGSREALLRFLTAAIEAKELPLTTIVFDAAEAPPGLPRTVMVQGMTVHYASNYDDADELIEELIAASNVPRSLLVVSSDHRIQRAARRRRAQFLDSDVWFAELSRRAPRTGGAALPSAKPQPGLSAEEIQYWIAEFGDATADEEPKRSSSKSRKGKADPKVELKNPFPPGYGEDLLNEG